MAEPTYTTQQLLDQLIPWSGTAAPDYRQFLRNLVNSIAAGTLVSVAAPDALLSTSQLLAQIAPSGALYPLDLRQTLRALVLSAASGSLVPYAAREGVPTTAQLLAQLSLGEFGYWADPRGRGLRPLVLWAANTFALRVVANRGERNASVVTIAGTADQVRESRKFITFGGQDVTEVRLVYSNYWCDLGAGGKETNTGNTVPLLAAFEYNGTTIQATFNGSASPRVMADGEALIVSDSLFPSQFGGLSVFAKNSTGWAKSSNGGSAGQAVGQALPSGMYLSDPQDSKNQGPTGQSQLLATGALTAPAGGTLGGNPLGPLAVIGRFAAPEISVLSHGDSISEGQGDAGGFGVSGGGYVARGLWNVNSRAIPLCRVARSGGSIAVTRTDGAKRRQLYKYATHGILGFGANDLFNPNTLATYQTNMLAEMADMRAAGIRYIAVPKISPRTSTADNFATTANQTQQTNWDPAKSDAVNAWLAGLVSSAIIDAVIDVDADWGDQGGATFWVPAEAGGDGTHPTTTLHTNAAANRLKPLAATWS